MRLIDNVMINAGAIVLITGGCLLIAAVVGLLALLVANIWIAASNKWRRILRAESLIYEYKQNQDEFMMWKHSHTVDAVPVVRCRECKHHRDKNEQEQQYLVEDILICTSPDATEDCWNAVWPDHFCSYGEKEGAD